MGLFNFFKKSEFAIVGKSLKWDDINGEVLRVVDFDRNGTIINQNGKVHAKSKFKPYGFLTVEWPLLDRKMKLPIVHQDDFLLASSVLDDPRLQKEINEFDFLVCYKPNTESDMRSFLHVLHFAITPKNTFEKHYELHKTILLGHDSEIIFGNWIWEGDLKVIINLNTL